MLFPVPPSMVFEFLIFHFDNPFNIRIHKQEVFGIYDIPTFIGYYFYWEIWV